MRTSNNKRRAAVITAMFLLLASQWMYYTLMLSMVRDDIMLYAELAVFFGFYILMLFDVPPFVSGLAAVFGCAALCGGYLMTQYDNQMYHLLPLIYLPALLFPVAQNEVRRNVNSGFCLVLRSLCCQLIPIAQIIAVIYVQKNTQIQLSSSAVISIAFAAFVMLLFCALYLVIAFTAKDMMNGKNKDALRRMRFLFDFAVVPMLLSVPLAALFLETAVINMALSLWSLNLIVLYEQKNPLVCAFASRFKNRLNSFLADDRS